MGRRSAELTDTACRNAKADEKVWYLPDHGRSSVPGLRLCIRPNGNKLWMLRYTLPRVDAAGAAMVDVSGKPVMRESTAGLGSYPDVSLASAREKATEARTAAQAGRHPTLARRTRQMSIAETEARTFEFAADRWLQQGAKQGFARTADAQARPWSAHHLERNTGLLKRFLLPALARIPLADVTSAMVEAPILKAYDAGTRESARRAAVIARQIMAYAKARRWISANPIADILEHPDLPKPQVKHFAALEPAQVGPMLRALGKSNAEWVTRAAILVMMFTGVRDYTLRAARWNEMDLEQALWTIPASRMKSRRDFQVPLPTQAVRVLEGLAQITRKKPDDFVFASHGKSGHLAENTLRACLHGIGFKVTAHGFRALLTTVLNEAGFNPDPIERQLDHAHADKVRAAYLRSDFMPQRREMMSWFADWCEAQCNQTQAPPIPTNVVSMRQLA